MPPLNCILLYEQRNRFGSEALLVDADILRRGTAAILCLAANKTYIIGHPEHLCSDEFVKALSELQKKVFSISQLLRNLVDKISKVSHLRC